VARINKVQTVSTRIQLGALLAALALSAAVTTAQARRLELSNQTFRAVWDPIHRLTFLEEGAGVNVACSVTLEGSFHSKTLSKVCGQLVGYVTKATLLHTCNGGDAFILNGTETLPNGNATPNTLPWHVRYERFEGTLPNITGVTLQLIGASFLVRIPFGALFIGCLYRSTAASPARAIAQLFGGLAEPLRADEESPIPISARLELGELCPANGFLRGNATLRVQGSERTQINVRLVS
jgi:hypothetical protein